MRNVRNIRRALPVAMVATTAVASIGALVGAGTTVWGSGLRGSHRFIPVASSPAPEFIRRFYQETSGHWPADFVTAATRAMDVIAEHTLTFNAAENGLANVMLAVNNINGAVVMPGEVFSFNAVVGERTEERGFRPGLMYEAGKLVSGVGGGVCIPSTALYIAALNADMEIVERYNHSGPVSYAEPGLDAAVAFGYKDFRFRNTSKEPVTIEARVDGDALSVTLRGRKVAGRRVVVETTGFGRLDFASETVTDPEVPEGEPAVEQEGRSGFVVTVVRTVYEGRKVVRRETVSRDVVAARSRIVRVNPLDDPASPEALAKAKEEEVLKTAAEQEALLKAASAEKAAETAQDARILPAASGADDRNVRAVEPKAPTPRAEKPAAVKAEAARAEPPKREPVKSEPATPEPVRTEPPKLEPRAEPVVAIPPPIPPIAPPTAPPTATPDAATS